MVEMLLQSFSNSNGLDHISHRASLFTSWIVILVFVCDHANSTA